MATIRTGILRKIFNLDPPDAIDPHSPLLVANNTRLPTVHPTVQNLENLTERFTAINEAYFNTATLRFQPSSLSNSYEVSQFLGDPEPFLDTLDPTLVSTRLFLYKIHSLQSLRFEIEADRARYLEDLAHDPEYLSEFDGAISMVNSEIEGSLLAAWEVRHAQATSPLNIPPGVRSYNFCTSTIASKFRPSWINVATAYS